MLEIRYRTSLPHGVPSPFEPWFLHAPEAQVHFADVRFEGDVGRSRLVATPGPGADREAFARDFDGFPIQGAEEWREAGKQDGSLVYDARWREPMFDPVPSIMKLARDVLGPGLESAATAARYEVVHRLLVPPGEFTHELWPRLRDDLNRFRDAYRLPVTLTLERFGPYAPAGLLPAQDAAGVLSAAFALGYYDTPPRASVVDVAFAAGVTGNEALAFLKRVERALRVRDGEN